MLSQNFEGGGEEEKGGGAENVKTTLERKNDIQNQQTLNFSCFNSATSMQLC